MSGWLEHLVIYAPNVGGGGGLILLRELLAAIWPVARLTAILDHRGRATLGALPDTIDIHWAEPSIRGRWRAERLLAGLTRKDGTVLCFHNLPPLLARRAQVFCYVQNAYVIGLIDTGHLSMRLRMRILLERLIAHGLRRHIDRYMVQTPTMAEALREWYGPDAPPVDILPFVATDLLPEDKAIQPNIGRVLATNPEPLVEDRAFIYVADGSFHKNHRHLFAAWRLLADQGIHPLLTVTLHPERDVTLCDDVDRLAKAGLRIVDLGQVSHTDILTAYRRSDALIFPSCAESFGIPLLEAQAAGLPILAPERDYVRDVCEPAETFDPASPRSIARAVLRFLGHSAEPGPLLSGQAFATTLCNLAASRQRTTGILPDDGAVAAHSPDVEQIHR